MYASLKILHAEDDEDDLLMIRRALERVNLTPIHTSPDGEDALQYLQGIGRYSDRNLHPLPDIIITDLKMPKLTGLELLESLSRSDSRLPVVVLSGSDEPSDVQRAYALGACSYFVKSPKAADLDAFASAIKSFWQGAKLPRAGSLNQT